MSETRARILNAAKAARLRAQAKNSEVPGLELPTLEKLNGELTIQPKEKLRRCGEPTQAPYVAVLHDEEGVYSSGPKSRHVSMRA